MNAMLALAAAATDPPIIDLDSTVFLQLLIFLIVAFVLSRFVFKPYLQVKAARSAGIEGARDEAKRLDEEAHARMADYDKSFAAARARAGGERAKLQGEAVARERAITDAARKATQEALDAARAKLAQDADATRKQLAPRTQEIARTIAKKILGREVA